MEKFIKIIKVIKIRNILFLIMLLIFNTYAWFIYATRVSSELSTHVSSWNVTFAAGEGESVTNVLIEVEKIYPGMDTVEETLIVDNNGEIKAELDYDIKSLKVFNENYVAGENITSDQILNKIQNEYPFKITIIEDEAELIAGTGSGSFTVKIEWPFETGNDEKDTFWGNKAYDYYEQNPDGESFELKIMLKAQQIKE